MKLTTTYLLTITTGLATTLMGINTLQAASLSTTTPSLGAIGKTAALAKQLQGKPVVVDIYASWCPACKNIAPTLSQLKQKYGDQANFVVLDVSDRQTTAAAEKTAAKLGLTSFLNANKSQTGTVAIIDPASGKIKKQFRNNANLVAYTTVIDSSIAQMGHGDAMKKPGDAMKKPGDAMKKP
jgi:thiol-disulfide isomerase/thioredoxin